MPQRTPPAPPHVASASSLQRLRHRRLRSPASSPPRPSPVPWPAPHRPHCQGIHKAHAVLPVPCHYCTDLKASNCSSPPVDEKSLSVTMNSKVFTPRSRLFSANPAGPSSHTFMEVIKTVLRQASATNERVAIRGEQKSYGYLQLSASALNVSNLLCNKDVTGTNVIRHLDGARVGIVAKPSAEFVAGILGTWLCGGVAVPLALSYPEAELLHVMNDSDISMILSTQEHQQLLKNVVEFRPKFSFCAFSRRSRVFPTTGE